LGTFLLLAFAVFAGGGFSRGRALWTLSLFAHLLAWAGFLVVVLGLYAKSAGGAATVYSPLILPANQWSAAAAFLWDFPSAALSLAACSVAVSFHFIARDLLDRSRATVASLAGYLFCILGSLGSDHPLLFCVFFAGTMVPRMVFAGMDSHESRIETVKETAFLFTVALFSLLVCMLAFAEPFRGTLDSWFKISGGEWVVPPGSLGLCLLLLAASISAGIFPFHGNARKIFRMGEIERAAPLALQPLVGFGLLFRFGLASFPREFTTFGSFFLGFFAIGIAYCAAGFAGARSARDRVFWLQQVLSCFVAVGFFSLSVKGWHGAEVLLFFECMVVPFLLFVLACHERRQAMPSVKELGRYPAFALSTALAALFALFLPVSVGFYGALLVAWSLVGRFHWPLPFVVLSMPLIAFAGVRIMYFQLGEPAKSASSSEGFTDLRRDELIAIFPLGLMLLFLGLIPRLLMGPIGVSVSGALRSMGIVD
jgi:NADH:ubiquinone oxidoreductase subunit 4 (subunit M)